MGSCCDDVLAGSHVWETGSQWSKWIKVTDVQHLNHCKSGDSGKNSVGLVYLFPQRLLTPAPALLCRFWKGPSHYWISVAAATFPKTSLSQRQTLRRRLCSNAKRTLTVCLIRNLWRRQTRSFLWRGETWVSSSEDSAHVDHTSPLIPAPVQLSKRNTLESPC